MDGDYLESRLAAILSADAVGYSRLIGDDPAETAKTLKSHLGAMGALIRSGGGRVVDATGDNLLAEFPSAVGAVRCGLEIQRELDRLNADLPDTRRMPFRIGIHLGEVRIEGGKIYGDGVNIAARLEALAEPGGICISAAVHEQVHKNVTGHYEDLGEKDLKNIAQPVRVYRLRPEPPTVDQQHTVPPHLHALWGQIHDFSLFIAEKTQHFVGRDFVVEALERFLQNQPRGYFFLVGDPGVGKSSFAARVIQKRKCIHHFNIRAEGINTRALFLKNVCAQLIVTYRLPYTSVPADAADDARFLNRLLMETSERLQEGEKAIIVIDALDEVDRTGHPEGANMLFLPTMLPKGIYVFATSRRETPLRGGAAEPLRLRIECEQKTFQIDHDSLENRNDIFAYLEQRLGRPRMIEYLKKHRIDEAAFVNEMSEKSEGNFMYLYYVLPEMENGIYEDFALDAIPAGLESYYEDHWQRMRGHDERAWFEYKLPIITVLAVARKPVSIDLLSEFSEVSDRARISSALEDWAEFLHKAEFPENGGRQLRYSLYHKSFDDFIVAKDQLKEPGVDLRETARKMAVDLLES